jgi:hypothetical protein
MCVDKLTSRFYLVSVMIFEYFFSVLSVYKILQYVQKDFFSRFLCIKNFLYTRMFHCYVIFIHSFIHRKNKEQN